MDPETRARFRTALQAPLGALGDQAIWAGWRPFCILVAGTLFLSGVPVVAATLVWKTVGLGALPGWEEIFGGPGAQYPRARALTPAWQIGYIALYGVFGALATLALGTRRAARAAVGASRPA